MDRKKFIKQSVLGSLGIVASTTVVKSNAIPSSTSTYDKLMDQVGFNHLPNLENRTMKTVLHKAHTRGHANHGWLDSHHSFSFANYRNPERMNFGVLRVLNDDIVAAGKGFGMHAHDNMEIISIPLQGDLQHKDSMGNVAVIKQGDVQVMSAGTGIYHSEYNQNTNKEVRFLQIWMFPKQRDVSPRYDQITLQNQSLLNQFYQILSPNTHDEGVWVHQNAWFHLGKFEAGCTTNYALKDKSNGVYIFILEGSAGVENEVLEKRDGLGIWDTPTINININTDAQILLMEVPMQMA